jgi:hypothetical protein
MDSSLNKPVSLYGHTLSATDSSSRTISCRDCDLSLDVPDIIRDSSAFVEVVYKLKLFGDVKDVSCESDVEDVEDMLSDVRKNIRPKGNGSVPTVYRRTY